ncbi:carboxypeptidase regulatory-like domain-containing protein [candidate division KSB1 bacterium]|nr:carboxypeptidase regulatory-like domain-containing protein [candidate division KSB1 bacterium]RQW10999.1 MAG: carboxypeptidase regulatory-like domain-containing protein [candidate division KSB1 bacterium]
MVCEVFVDMNGNRQIDAHDERVQYLNLVDGLGWIRDGDLIENGIPGDETGRDGCIRSTLRFGEHLRPYSPQTWIIRMTDADQTTACALLNWDLAFAPARLTGSVRDADTDELLPHVLVRFRDAHYPEIERLAITDAGGKFVVQLANGEWQVSTTHPLKKEYRRTTTCIKVREEKNVPLDLRVRRYDAFIDGCVRFEDGSPTENITVALQNRTTLEFYSIRTDQQGHFKVGVEPGCYIVTTSHYYSRYLGNDYWPDGFFAEPAVDTLHVQEGQIISENITFIGYPAAIRGSCLLDGSPLADVLIQGVALDPVTKKQKLYQTFSKIDGSYALGIFPHAIKSVIAQKEGYFATPLAGFHGIKVDEGQICQPYDFQFIKQTGLMKLSGFVYGSARQPAADVYVVAYNIWEDGPEGHLITRTDANGYYSFDIKVEGDWQIGAHREGADSRPEVYYKYMSPGLQYDHLDFHVSEGSDAAGSGQLLLSDFNFTPHFPNPFFKETVIDFVLPKSSHTQIKLFSIDGDELTTLLDHDLSSGYQKVRWDGTDHAGNLFANGIYLCRIESHEHTRILPITLLR